MTCLETPYRPDYFCCCCCYAAVQFQFLLCLTLSLDVGSLSFAFSTMVFTVKRDMQSFSTVQPRHFNSVVVYIPTSMLTYTAVHLTNNRCGLSLYQSIAWDPRMQKLKPPLRRTHSCIKRSGFVVVVDHDVVFKRGVDHNKPVYGWPTARGSASLRLTFPAQWAQFVPTVLKRQSKV